MPKALMMKAGCIFALSFLFACSDHKLEKSFFDQPRETMLARLRHYSLTDQYKIFRYGNDVIEPPLMILAGPIAERGPEAVPFLLSQLNSAQDAVSVRDILLVFETMNRIKSYNVKADMALMNALAAKVSTMKDMEWRAVCSRMLQRIRDS